MNARTRGSEILEVFEVMPIGGAPTGATEPQPPAPPRRRMAPALIAAAVVVIGVVVVATGNDPPQAMPAATTVAPSTTAPPTTVAARRVLLPVVVDAPDGYSPAYARQAFGTPGPAGISELWAGLGDSVSSGGHWILVEASANSGAREWLNGDRRVQIGDEPAVVTASDPTLGLPPTVTFAPGDRWYVSITGNIGVEAMIGVLRGISMVDIDDDGRVDQFAFADDSSIRDLVLRSRIDGDDGGGYAVWGAAADSMVAYSPGALDRWVSVTGGPAQSDQRRWFTSFFLDHPVQLANGTTVATGRLLRAGEMVALEIAGVSITISGDVGQDVLQDFAGRTHIATPDEWQRVQRDAHYPNPETGPDLSPIEIGEDSLDGSVWTIDVYGPDVDDAYQYSINLGPLYGGSGSISGDRAASGIEVQAVTAGTFLIAHAPRSTPPGAVLRVDIAGRSTPIELVLGDPDPLLPWLTVSTSFADVGPWTAEIVAVDGTVLALTTSEVT